MVRWPSPVRVGAGKLGRVRRAAEAGRVAVGTTGCAPGPRGSRLPAERRDRGIRSERRFAWELAAGGAPPGPVRRHGLAREPDPGPGCRAGGGPSGDRAAGVRLRVVGGAHAPGPEAGRAHGRDRRRLHQLRGVGAPDPRGPGAEERSPFRRRPGGGAPRAGVGRPARPRRRPARRGRSAGPASSGPAPRLPSANTAEATRRIRPPRVSTEHRALSASWLGDVDSNHDSQIQSLLSYP